MNATRQRPVVTIGVETGTSRGGPVGRVVCRRGDRVTCTPWLIGAWDAAAREIAGRARRDGFRVIVVNKRDIGVNVTGPGASE